MFSNSKMKEKKAPIKKKKKPELIEVKTEAKYLPISPRKLRLIVGAVKQLEPEEALRRLAFLNKKGARFLIKAIKTVLADAKNNFGLAEKNLRFGEILVNEGPRLKRRDKSHGARFASGLIQKRRSHLIVKIIGQTSGTKS